MSNQRQGKQPQAEQAQAKQAQTKHGQGKQGQLRAGCAATRIGWGMVLLARPERLLQLTGAPWPQTAKATVRVLGARQVLQGAVLLAGGHGSRSRLVLDASTATDALHAASMVALAATRPRWRTPAAIDALIAGTLAGAGWPLRQRKPAGP